MRLEPEIHWLDAPPITLSKNGSLMPGRLGIVQLFLFDGKEPAHGTLATHVAVFLSGNDIPYPILGLGGESLRRRGLFVFGTQQNAALVVRGK